MPETRIQKLMKRSYLNVNRSLYYKKCSGDSIGCKDPAGKCPMSDISIETKEESAQAVMRR
jgi:hypothetical protein